MLGSSNEAEVDNNRRRLLAALGGSASVALAGCSAILDDDEEADDGDDDDDDNGEEEGRTNADKAQAAWERAVENPAPEDADIRNEAYVEMEEAVRDDAIIIPFQHGLTERFWYDWVDVPLTGVLGPHQQQHIETEVENDDELSMTVATFASLDPIMSTDTASSEVINQIYEPLVRYPNGELQIENKLIEDYSVDEDSTTWTFELKEGVEFHGGEELTADDVVYSFRRTVESPNTQRADFTLGVPTGLGMEVEEDDNGDIVPESLGVEAVDEYTVELSLTTPQPDALDVLTYSSFAILPEGYVGDIDGYDGDVDHDEFQTDTANGTGPFEYDDFTIDDEMRVVRNDDYHDGTPNVESIHWNIVEDIDAEWTYILEENADIFLIQTPNYDPDLVDVQEDIDDNRDLGEYGPLENDEVVNYLSIEELSTRYFGFNATAVPREVRQAVAYALDHSEIIEDVLVDRAVPATSFVPPGIWPTGEEGYQEWEEEWPYGLNESDMESANELLEEAGYTPDDPLEVSLSAIEGNADDQESAEIMRQRFAGTGLELDTEEVLFDTLQERGEDGDLEMWVLGWIWSWDDVAYGSFQLEPKNTDTSLMLEEANGFYLDWQTELEEEA